MRSIDNSFYHSSEWKACRSAYIKLHPLCEQCESKGLVVPAEIVHHKIHLTETNVKDPSIALNFNNLESVCRDCHNKIHFTSDVERRWSFDKDGNLRVHEAE